MLIRGFVGSVDVLYNSIRKNGFVCLIESLLWLRQKKGTKNQTRNRKKTRKGNNTRETVNMSNGATSNGRRGIFRDDVELEDLDNADPFQKFGGEQLSRPAGQPQNIPSASQQSSGGNPGPSPSIVYGSPTGGTRSGNPMKRNIFAGPDETPKPPGTSAATVRRQVMMINTDLAVGHEKTLKNTIGLKRSANSTTSLNGSITGGGGAANTPKHSSTGSMENSSASHKLHELAAVEHQETANQSRVVPRISTLKGLPKTTRMWHKIGRTLYQMVNMFAPIMALALAAATVSSSFWVVRKDTTNQFSTWSEITTFAGLCTCQSNFDVYCSTLRNTFQQISQMSGILIGCEVLLIGVLLFEFSFYGIFGGPEYFTRGTLILEVMCFATATLTVIQYGFVYTTSYCDAWSFQVRGFQIGWGLYLRCLESLGFFVVLCLTANAGFASSRGPPCSLLFLASVLFAMTCCSITAASWMTNSQNIVYGITSNCVCGPGCSQRTDLADLLSSTRGLTVFQCIVGVLTLFFVLLRAVDNVGATLKFSEISGTLFLGIAGANIANLFRLDFNVRCNIPGQEDEYIPAWCMYVIAGSAGFMLVFLILNGLYMTRAFVRIIEDIIIDHLPEDSPWALWVEAREQLREQRAQSMPKNIAASANKSLVKGVNAPKSGTGKPSPDDPSEVADDDDEEFYKTGPFALVGQRTFYQVFWWDELMSVGQMQAEELEEALDEDAHDNRVSSPASRRRFTGEGSRAPRSDDAEESGILSASEVHLHPIEAFKSAKQTRSIVSNDMEAEDL